MMMQLSLQMKLWGLGKRFVHINKGDYAIQRPFCLQAVSENSDRSAVTEEQVCAVALSTVSVLT